LASHCKLSAISLLSVVTLRQDFVGVTGADAASLVTAGKSLVAFHDWTFLLGFVAGAGNGLLLGYLMYRSALVPRAMAVLGLIGGPLAFASATAVLFGLYQQTSGGRSSRHSRRSLGRRRLASGSSPRDSSRLRSYGKGPRRRNGTPYLENRIAREQ
jgi:hypothetical protein